MKKTILFLLTSISISLFSCGTPEELQSASGVKKANVTVSTDLNGQTNEQKNVIGKNMADSEIGKIRHLYVISPFTGKVLEYHLIKSKVTSSGKRLTPKEVYSINTSIPYSFKFPINGKDYYTNEVPNEDGTFGDSVKYIYFWDARGTFQQIISEGGSIYIRISDVPLTFNNSDLTFK